MSGNRERWAQNLSADQDSNFLAAEEPLDRGTLWRLGGIGVVAIASLVGAVLAQQSSATWNRAPAATTAQLDMQSRQIERITQETQTEFNRMALAVDQLNNDRDKIKSRVATVEAASAALKRTVTTLDSPGYIQAAINMYQTTPALSDPSFTVAKAPAVTEPAPAAPESIAAAPPENIATLPQILVTAPPELPPTFVVEPDTTGSVTQTTPPLSVTPTAVIQTQFGIDLGGAKSVEGLRAMWRGLIKTDPSVADLQPILKVRERGAGVQFRLVAGPFNDAAEAARHCAVWTGRGRACEMSAFEGQRISMQAAPPKQATATPRAPTTIAVAPIPPQRRRTSAVTEPHVIVAAPIEDAVMTEDPAPRPSLSSMFGFNRN